MRLQRRCGRSTSNFCSARDYTEMSQKSNPLAFVVCHAQLEFPRMLEVHSVFPTCVPSGSCLSSKYVLIEFPSMPYLSSVYPT